MKIRKIDVIKADRAIRYTKDCFGQSKKYEKIEADTIGPLFIRKYLNELGNQLINERGMNSPEFEKFEKLEEKIRGKILEIQSLKELEGMCRAYDLI